MPRNEKQRLLYSVKTVYTRKDIYPQIFVKNEEEKN